MADLLDGSESTFGAIDIQICFARKQSVTIIKLSLPRNSTIHDAFEINQILKKYPEIDFDICKVGIFGKLASLNTVLQQGDRIEIYRPLTADPMEARRRRVAKQLNKKPTA